MLLSFIAETVADEGLDFVNFENWTGSASEIESSTLSLIADKAKALKHLGIDKMSGATVAGKHTLACFAADIINRSPPLTWLSLYDTNFETSEIEAIQDALTNKKINSLTDIYLYGNQAYFNTDSKCEAWATVLMNQLGLNNV